MRETQTAVTTPGSSTQCTSERGRHTHRGVVEPEDGVAVLFVRAAYAPNSCRALCVEPMAADVHDNEQLEEKGIVWIEVAQVEEKAGSGTSVGKGDTQLRKFYNCVLCM